MELRRGSFVDWSLGSLPVKSCKTEATWSSSRHHSRSPQRHSGRLHFRDVRNVARRRDDRLNHYGIHWCSHIGWLNSFDKDKVEKIHAYGTETPWGCFQLTVALVRELRLQAIMLTRWSIGQSWFGFSYLQRCVCFGAEAFFLEALHGSKVFGTCRPIRPHVRRGATLLD
jgi:hypothetical protein